MSEARDNVPTLTRFIRLDRVEIPVVPRSRLFARDKETAREPMRVICFAPVTFVSSLEHVQKICRFPNRARSAYANCVYKIIVQSRTFARLRVINIPAKRPRMG